MSDSMSTQTGPSPTISIFLPGYSPMPTSIVISEIIPDTTGYPEITYQLACDDSVEFTDCPFGTNFLMFEGPTSVSWTTDGDFGTTSVQCNFMSNRASATCTTVSASSSDTSTFSTNEVTAVTWQKAAVSNAADQLTGSLVSLTAASAAVSATASSSDKKSGSSSGASSTKSGAGATSSTHSGAAPGSMSTGAVAISGAMAALALAAAAL